jgi:hypothetical protein
VGVVLKISAELEIRNGRQDGAKSGSVEDMLSDVKATSASVSISDAAECSSFITWLLN